MADAPPASTAGTITVQQAAALLMCSDRHVQMLVKSGHINKPERGRYNLVSCVHGRIAALQEERKNETKTAAENRVKDARAREIEMRNARADKALIDTADAISLVDEILGIIRSGFSGLPARMTRDLTERAKMEGEIDAILNRASARLVKKGGDLRAGRETSEDDEAADG